MHGDGGSRTRGLSPDKRALWPLSYAPTRAPVMSCDRTNTDTLPVASVPGPGCRTPGDGQEGAPPDLVEPITGPLRPGTRIARAGLEPATRAHEAREMAASPPRIAAGPRERRSTGRPAGGPHPTSPVRRSLATGDRLPSSPFRTCDQRRRSVGARRSCARMSAHVSRHELSTHCVYTQCYFRAALPPFDPGSTAARAARRPTWRRSGAGLSREGPRFWSGASSSWASSSGSCFPLYNAKRAATWAALALSSCPPVSSGGASRRGSARAWASRAGRAAQRAASHRAGTRLRCSSDGSWRGWVVTRARR